MSRLNDEFMEAYKSLDKICREMFHGDKGVTAYIDEMQGIHNGAKYVSSWDATLRKLKELRHIRNNYAHEVGTTYTDICTQADIDWLNNFYNAILHTEDALAEYRKASIRKTDFCKPIQEEHKEDGNFVKICFAALVAVIIIVSIIVAVLMILL